MSHLFGDSRECGLHAVSSFRRVNVTASCIGVCLQYRCSDWKLKNADGDSVYLDLTLYQAIATVLQGREDEFVAALVEDFHKLGWQEQQYVLMLAQALARDSGAA
jgi:hypothetical protein